MFDVSSYRGYLRRAYGIMPEANKFAKTDEADHHGIKNWRMVRLAASNPSLNRQKQQEQQQMPKTNQLNRRFFNIGNFSNSFGIGGGLLGAAVAASALAYSQKHHQQQQKQQQQSQQHPNVVNTLLLPNNHHRRFFDLGYFSNSFGGGGSGGFFGGGNYGADNGGEKFGAKQKERCQFISYHHEQPYEKEGGLFKIGLAG